MAVLKYLTICFSFIVAVQTAFAGEDEVEPDPRALAAQEQAKSLCSSTSEYMATLKFLRNNKDLVIPESTSRLIAEKVSGGCDGAAERFSRVLILLKTVGLSDHQSLRIALEFAGHPPAVQKNFSEIFSHAFLNEFFDYEYPLAVNLAYELSKNYEGDPAQVREDFIELVHFCKNDKILSLPNKMCAEFTIKLARLSQYYPDGVRSSFYKLFKDLREKKEFALDVKTALDISYNVLKGGPRATDNFFSGFRFATSKDGLALDQRQAMTFALKMADRSFTGSHPPVILDSAVNPGVVHAADP